MNKLSVIFLFLLVFTITGSEAASLKGKIRLDDSWEPVIYLSLINSFDDLNTASYDFLINAAEIDSTGYFQMDGLQIPESNRIYRLHVCKKGDPVSTIIIGGKDENFIHFIMNGTSEITLNSPEEILGIQQSKVFGNPANKGLDYLIALQKELQTPPDLPSKQKRELVRQQIIAEFKKIADTSSFAIIRLMAMHLIIESSSEPDLDFMEKTLHTLTVSDSSNPYLKAVSNELDYLNFQSSKKEVTIPLWLKWLLMVILSLLVLIGIWLWFRKKTRGGSDQKIERINSLSIQEKKVFELLKTGATNKEISRALNIEVSTVKSHVHKIYSRLGVKSRKEIVNKTW